jgi:hypothetical protein
LIERLFGKLKPFRAIATRHDKLARNFLGAIRIVGVAWESLQDCTLSGRWRGHREQGEFGVDRRSPEVMFSKVHAG